MYYSKIVSRPKKNEWVFQTYAWLKKTGGSFYMGKREKEELGSGGQGSPSKKAYKRNCAYKKKRVGWWTWNE